MVGVAGLQVLVVGAPQWLLALLALIGLVMLVLLLVVGAVGLPVLLPVGVEELPVLLLLSKKGRF